MRRSNKMIKTIFPLVVSIAIAIGIQNVLAKLDILGETSSWFNDDTSSPTFSTLCVQISVYIHPLILALEPIIRVESV
jgi:hypothetical protein